VHAKVISSAHAFAIGKLLECNGGYFVEGLGSRWRMGETGIGEVGRDAVGWFIADRDRAERFRFEEVEERFDPSECNQC